MNTLIKEDKMEEYDYKWLLEILIGVRMAGKIFPTFWTSEEDPKEITELKNKLYKMSASIEYLEHQINRMVKEKGMNTELNLNTVVKGEEICL